MHELITDPSFDLNRTKEYKLSIQVSLDGFSFSMINIGDNRLIGLKNVPAIISTEKFIARRFGEWIQSEEIFNQEFAEVEIQYSTGNFTAIPPSFYQEKKQNELASMLFEQEMTSQVISNIDETSEFHFLFTLPANLSAEITKKFENFKIVHPATILAQKGLSLFTQHEKGALLYFSKSSFLLLLFSDKKFLLANQYNFSHANDVVYYLMAVLNQFKIKPYDVKLCLAGKITGGNESEKLLRKYFDKTEFWFPENPINNELFKNNLHRFITLI